MVIGHSRKASWFYRRPLFWWALAAIAAVLIEYAWQPPPWTWGALLAAGIVLLLLGASEAGVALAFAGFFALSAARSLAPTDDPFLRDGRPVTLRGVVTRDLGSGRFLFDSGFRLTLSGWAVQHGRLGLIGPGGAAEGDVVQVSGVLHRPLPATNPGSRSPRLDWARRGMSYVLDPRPQGYRRLGRQNLPPWREWSRRVRERVFTANRRSLSPAAAIIANDFLIGDEYPPDPVLASHVEQAFRDSGTIHILVVSGTQVSFVLAFFIWLGWRFWRWRYAAWIAGVIALAGFYLLTGGESSVTRAAVMGGMVVAALVFGREPDWENCLGGAALVLLLINPLTPFDVAAQLSFLAVWALIRMGRPLYHALGPADLPEGSPAVESGPRSLHRALALVSSTSVAAHLGTAPVLAFHFQRTTWSGILANMVLALPAFFFTYLALLHVLLASIGVNLLASCTSWLAMGLYGWASFFSSPPFGSRAVFPPPVWLIPLILAALAAPGLFRRSRAGTLAVALAAAAVLLLSERLPAPAPSRPALRALDVGQGDCLLLQGADGSNVLVDAGPPDFDPDVSGIARTLRALRIGSLDAVVVSHPHADHIGGLPALLREMPARTLIHGVRAGPPEWSQVLEAAARSRVPIVPAQAGDRIRIRSSTLSVLGPLEDGLRLASLDPNEESLVARWESGDARVLLTGDTGPEEERDLLRWGPQLQADLLKVAHHGSRTSTSGEWLQAVKPVSAVISCGRNNPFGHPAPETLQRLQSARIPVVRTDQGGMLTVHFHRRGVEIERFAAGS